MGLTDKSRNRGQQQTLLTDLTIANNIENILTRSLHHSRNMLQRITGLLKKAPGGKRGVIAAMGTADAAEAQQIIAKMRSIVNNHKAEFTDGIADPLA